ncbi:MAG: beta-galactosidase [Candidatus Omnitrophica bacterium]|nr:beta-galactosidase [Candidatus Omnitrophota bacterium]
MSRKIRNFFQLFFSLGSIFLLFFVSWPAKANSSLSPLVTESLKERIRVLYLAEGSVHQHYYVLNFLERQSKLRFIYQRDSNPEASGDDDSAAITDGILWDNASFPHKLQERVARLEGYLRRQQFDFIVLGAKKFPPEIEKLIAQFVTSGGILVWLGGLTINEGLLSELCPFVSLKIPPKKSPLEKVRVLQPDSPFLSSFPAKEMFEQISYSPVTFKEEVLPLVTSQPGNFGLLGLMPKGKGQVVAFNCPSLVPCLHLYGEKENFDSDFLWVRFWEEAGFIWKKKQVSFKVNVSPEAVSKPAGGKLEIDIKVLSSQTKRPILLSISLENSAGKVVGQKSVKMDPGQKKVAVSLELPFWLPGGTYLIKVTGSNGQETASAFALAKVIGELDLRLEADRPGVAAGQEIRFKATVTARRNRLLKAHWLVLNPFGRAVAYQTQPAPLFAESENIFTFTYKWQDYGPEGWAYRTVLMLKDNHENTLGQTDCWVWQYQPWTMREKFLFSNYWAGSSRVPAGLMPLFVRYHRSIGYNGGHTWKEPYYSRFNMRAWYQWSATMMEKFTNNFSTPDFSHLGKMAEDIFKKSHHSAAYVIQDFGEETGFYYHWSNNPFARTWLKDEDIPNGAHRFFQLYLKEKYGSVENLNSQWETKYQRFEEIRLSTAHGYPAGWLFQKPPAPVPENIAPILDTHGFFFWYTRKVAETITRSLQQLNPVSDWSMSFSLTFNLFSPIPMTMIHPVYHARVLTPWHDQALARSKNGATPFFSFHWGFDEDERIWGQFWNQSLAALATFISNWGSQFNCDLTHSRSTLLLKRLMTKVRPREQLFMNCYPVRDFDVGIYHPDLDWQTVHSRPNFYLRGQGPEAQTMGQLGYKPVGTGWLGGPEFQVFNALNASGYVTRFITEEQIPFCRVIVVPYVETMPETVAAKLRDFVSTGGTLITMPVLATHNGYGKPYKEIPGGKLSEVLGLTVEPTIIGQRTVVLPGSNPVIPWRFTQRPGSEPAYIWSFGHQKVKSLSPDTVVVVKLYDGQPAITFHPYGQGKSIHLNMFTFDPFCQYEFSHFQAESLRQIFDSLVQLAGVKTFLRVECPLLYGQAVHDWVLYHYQLKDSPVRILAIFSDRTSPTITAEIVLREPVTQVINILTGEKIPLQPRSGGYLTEETDPFAFSKRSQTTLPPGYCFPVRLSPGQVAFFAFIPFKFGPIQSSLRKPLLTAGKEPLELIIEILDEKGKLAIDGRPVHLDVIGPNKSILPEMSRRLTVKGKQFLSLPIPVGAPSGVWTIKVTDVLSGWQRCLYPQVVSSSHTLPGTDDIFCPSAIPSRIEISDAEFCGLLDALTELYLTGASRDKVALSYYCHESDVSRHRIIQLLFEVDWMKKINALRKHLACGKTVILLGEDLGIDPITGMSLETLVENQADVSIDPAAGGNLPAFSSANIIPALEQLTGVKNLYSLLRKQGKLTIPVGPGKIFVDLTSFDEGGQENRLFLVNHHRWLQRLPAALRQKN